MSKIKIKTLDEILADMEKPISVNLSADKSFKSDKNSDKKSDKKSTHNANNRSNLKKDTHKPSQTKKDQYQQRNTTHPHSLDKSIKSFDQKSTSKDSSVKPLPTSNITDVMDDKTLDAIKNVAVESLAITDRQTNYLRWLAFYYLSRREHSQSELRQKLLDKNCDPSDVEALLIEFAQKGYQSDERFAMMLVREAVRQGRGRRHLAQKLWQHDINLPYAIDELFDKVSADTTDGTILENDNNEEINWLKLAVEARSKKYGNNPPTTPKEKARQLRFLQYRGFDVNVCFDALKMTLADFEE